LFHSDPTLYGFLNHEFEMRLGRLSVTRNVFKPLASRTSSRTRCITLLTSFTKTLVKCRDLVSIASGIGGDTVILPTAGATKGTDFFEWAA
jgi:hypothetical protein